MAQTMMEVEMILPISLIINIAKNRYIYEK